MLHLYGLQPAPLINDYSCWTKQYAFSNWGYCANMEWFNMDNHHTFTQAIGVCFYDIIFPNASTTKLRIIDMTVGGSQSSNVNFREIEIFEALVGCSSVRVPIVVNVSAPKACDVGVFSLVEPVSSIYLSASEPVKVLLKIMVL